MLSFFCGKIVICLKIFALKLIMWPLFSTLGNWRKCNTLSSVQVYRQTRFLKIAWSTSGTVNRLVIRNMWNSVRV